MTTDKIEQRIQAVTEEKLQHYKTTENACNCMDFIIKHGRGDISYKCKHIMRFIRNKDIKPEELKFNKDDFKDGMGIDEASELYMEDLLNKLVAKGELILDRKTMKYRLLK